MGQDGIIGWKKAKLEDIIFGALNLSVATFGVATTGYIVGLEDGLVIDGLAISTGLVTLGQMGYALGNGIKIYSDIKGYH